MSDERKEQRREQSLHRSRDVHSANANCHPDADVVPLLYLFSLLCIP